MTSIIPLAEIDPQLVEALLDAAFGADRHNRTAYRLREGMDMLEGLSLAAVDQEKHELLGSIQCWPIALTDEEGKKYPMIMVGPVAVYPDFQREGIGRAMMTALLQEIQPNDPLPLVMIGDPEYYERFFGFSAEKTAGWTLPGPWEPSRLLVRCNPAQTLPTTGTLGPWTR
ncbi:GNAT family N-acetyltransferase [Sphingorhabdus sp. 109]|uniref:GNAT family N-acetyltransferase n=1 Tax=Sphingorhabdus sp. 109 TaxID=2653173 RepID=UPI0012EFA395|nr:N-acetyltransferase [Sphingorhabdus sp. 109]VWX59889.1 GCN5 family acetyltransferase [Sphingorhabdus sp. 109]